MNKVFLLLRQNHQSGPYTFDELLQQKLLPSDLIWIEGKSDAWYNPDDLWQFLKHNPMPLSADSGENKKTELPATPQPHAEPATTLKSLTPEMELEQRAEEIRRRALEYAANTPPPKIKVEQTSNRGRTIHIADESIQFTHHRRSGSVTAPQLLVAAIVAFFLVGIVYLGWSPINSKKHEVSGVAIPAGATVVQEPQPEAVPAVAMDAAATTTTDALIVDPVFEETAAIEPAPKKETAKKENYNKQPEAKSEIKETPIQKEEPVETATALPAVTEAEPKAETTKEPEAPTTETVDKKKTFGQVIKGIFKKKNKGEDKEVKETTNDN